jgi:tripartite ATP-independent transporter DctM subunit
MSPPAPTLAHVPVGAAARGERGDRSPDFKDGALGRAVDALVLLGSFAVLCALGMPVAYTLGLASLIAALWTGIPMEAVMLKISDGTDDFSLLAIPFFVLAGAIMAEGGMAARLVNLAKVLVGFIRGGLAVVNVVASTFFAGVSGSSVADTASIGMVMIPQMVKAGYSRVFSTNVTICGSVQAVLIPPSHNAVIYSLAAGGTISIAHLFLAGVFPGLLFGGCLIGLILFTAYRRGFPKSDPVPLRQALRIARDAVWGLITMVIILGGILGGVFTATESAAVACVYAFVVTLFVYRDYTWRDLPHLIHRTVKTVAMVMMLIGFSVAFGYMMALMQIPTRATEFFLTLTTNKYMLLLLVNVLLLGLGTFLDMAPMILICTPILLPVLVKVGVDPVHFGMILLVNAGIGLITPPVGPTLFVGCALGRVTMEEVSRELWPFYAAMILALLLVTYVPAISLWLPSLITF